MPSMVPALRTVARCDTRLSLKARLFLQVLHGTRAELAALVEETLAENPCVEEWPGGRALRGRDRAVAFDSLPAPAPSLTDALLAQLRDLWLSPVERHVGEVIIGNLDDDGFLEVSVDAVAVLAGTWPDVEPAERMLACVQTFDPPGIAARDHVELFLLQLRHRGFDDGSLPVRLVREHLAPRARRSLERIAAALGATPDEVRAAAGVVARLDRSPGRRGHEPPARAVPDVTVEEIDGELVVSVSDDGIPALRLCQVPGGGAALKTWRRDASWLVAALAQRRETLHAVTSCIVRAQRGFLTGSAPLEPLVLRQVAAEVGRHESTICRAVADRYVATPRGVLPLKAFFARRAARRSGATAALVKERIADILSREDPACPLTDDLVARRLADEDIRVSRRTAAKYREELGLLPATMRRREQVPTVHAAMARLSVRADAGPGMRPGTPVSPRVTP